MNVLTRILCLLVLAASALCADSTTLAAQKKLRNLGFYDGTVDGSYGSQTAAAIRRYQLAENLRVTGELNPQTLNRLGISAPSPTPAPRTKQKAAGAVPLYVAIPDLFKGGPYISAPTEFQIATIKQAQKNLKILGYYAGPVNGQPSGELVASIKAWQSDARFRQTGRFDESTLKGLDLMPN